MPQYRRFLRLLKSSDYSLGEAMLLKLNPVDPPSAFDRVSPTQKNFQEAVEMEIEELALMGRILMYRNTSGIYELPYADPNSKTEEAGTEHPTDVIMALTRSFELDSVNRAIDLVRELDCCSDSAGEVLNLLGIVLSIRKVEIANEDKALRELSFMLEIEIQKKLYRRATFSCNFEAMRLVLSEMVRLYGARVSQDWRLRPEYIKWVLELSTVQEIQGEPLEALNTLCAVGRKHPVSSSLSEGEREIQTEVSRLRCEVNQFEVSYAVLGCADDGIRTSRLGEAVQSKTHG